MITNIYISYAREPRLERSVSRRAKSTVDEEELSQFRQPSQPLWYLSGQPIVVEAQIPEIVEVP